MHFNLNQSLLSGIAEEVSEFNPGPASQNEPRITSMITNLKGLINGNSSQQFTTLTCRSIRVGSYKILTKERVFFTEKAIYLKVIEYYFFLISSISRQLLNILTNLLDLIQSNDNNKIFWQMYQKLCWEHLCRIRVGWRYLWRYLYAGSTIWDFLDLIRPQ